MVNSDFRFAISVAPGFFASAPITTHEIKLAETFTANYLLLKNKQATNYQDNEISLSKNLARVNIVIKVFLVYV